MLGRFPIRFPNQTSVKNQSETMLKPIWNTYIPTYLHTYIPTYLHTYVPTYLRTYVPTCLRTYVPTYVPTYLRTYIHTGKRTYMHACTHIYGIHTYIHTKPVPSVGLKPTIEAPSEPSTGNMGRGRANHRIFSQKISVYKGFSNLEVLLLLIWFF